MGRLWDDFGAPRESEDGPPTTKLKPPPGPAQAPRPTRRHGVDLDAPDRLLDTLEESKKPAT